MKSKVDFDIAYGGYKNEQENIHSIREIAIKQEVVETSEVAEMCQPQPLPLSTPTLETEKMECKPSKREKESTNMKLLLKLQWKKKETSWKKLDFEWNSSKRYPYEMYKFQYL